MAELESQIRAGYCEQRMMSEAFAGMRYASETQQDLLSILRWYARRGRMLLQSPSVEACVEKFLWSKQAENLNAVTIMGYRSRLRRFAERYGHWLPELITEQEVLLFLRPWKNPTTRLGRIHCLSTFFEWTVHKHYATANPIGGIIRPPRYSSSGDFYRLDEVRDILSRVRHEEQLGFWVLSLFSGMRTVEIRRLNSFPDPWQLVRLADGVIEIPKEHSKTARRTFPMTLQLRAWLQAVRRQGAPFYPAEVRATHISEVRRAVLCQREVDNPASHFNMGRRSFISYSLALAGASYDAVARVAGTSEKMIRKYYRREVGPAAADAYFQLLPE